ncbi:hypothetical protein C8R43DRAFT_1232327 [Mycena crocata]|nr:hypothetical protein C8R43DRAFT_1232327 [Mycena crocata]
MPPGQVSTGRGTGLRPWTGISKRSKFSESGFESSHNGDSKNGSHNSTDNGSNSSNGSPGGSGSSPGEDNEGSSSSGAQIPSSAGKPPPPPPCTDCVPDNDPQVFYSSSWTLNSHGPFVTSHDTDTVGSWLSLNFSGSAITVFGSVPASNESRVPPTAAYSIDASEPFVTAEPRATRLIPDQPLFAASQLSHDPHLLVINVTDVHPESRFSIGFFKVTPWPPEASASAIPPQSSSPVSSSTSSAAQVSSATSTSATIVILAGVLGSVVFVLLCFSALLFVIIRRRRQRAHKSQSLKSSLFTSSESILMWSRGSPSLASTSAYGGKTGLSTMSEKSSSYPRSIPDK